MGHNLCLDIFGGPSDDEARAGLTAHGEAPVVIYRIEAEGDGLVMRADLPLAQLRVERRVSLRDAPSAFARRSRIWPACDRPVGWTQHVTLGPPFLNRGQTQFRASVTRSRVYESQFGADDYLVPGADFDWPLAPGIDGNAQGPSGFRARRRSRARTRRTWSIRGGTMGFSSRSRRKRDWRSAMSGSARDFPWLGIWEENGAGSDRRGMARRSRAGWSSACRRFRNHAGR